MGKCRICKTCKWYKCQYTPGPWNDLVACTNYYSELYGQILDCDYTCDRWEEKENKADN